MNRTLTRMLVSVCFVVIGLAKPAPRQRSSQGNIHGTIQEQQSYVALRHMAPSQPRFNYYFAIVVLGLDQDQQHDRDPLLLPLAIPSDDCPCLAVACRDPKARTRLVPGLH